MKIITGNTVYVQKNDIRLLTHADLEIPGSIFMEVFGNGVVIIEWADTINDYLPEERLDIKFKVIDEDSRMLVFVPHGRVYEDICEAIL